jgi:hypothetical protein
MMKGGDKLKGITIKTCFIDHYYIIMQGGGTMMSRIAYLFTVVLLLLSFTTSTVYADSAAWIHYIKSGHPFKVVFDKTKGKFDDSKYTGDWHTDPMGTLKGGETYTVVYKKGNFECTGFNQGTGNVGTWTYSNANPSDSLISLWGRVYVFAGNGDVYDPTYGVVGHMVRTR